MRIQPVHTNNITMGMKYKREVYRLSEESYNTQDLIQLDNGKQLHVNTININNRIKSKLQCLKDDLGNIIKSRLTLYKGNAKKIIKLK